MKYNTKHIRHYNEKINLEDYNKIHSSFIKDETYNLKEYSKESLGKIVSNFLNRLLVVIMKRKKTP